MEFTPQENESVIFYDCLPPTDEDFSVFFGIHYLILIDCFPFHVSIF